MAVRPGLPPALRVGLLGGSFNPAHAGHLYASIEALRRLALDQVWWLVSPQNPLKPAADTAPLTERLALARQQARHPRLRVLALEARFGTRYTIDTLRRLVAWPGYRFVWLIGADNLQQIHRWRHWTQLMALAPVAVIERQPYSYPSLAGPAAVRFGCSRIEEDGLARLVDTKPPAWAFLRLRPHPASSTAIRGGSGDGRPAELMPTEPPPSTSRSRPAPTSP